MKIVQQDTTSSIIVITLSAFYIPPEFSLFAPVEDENNGTEMTLGNGVW